MKMDYGNSESERWMEATVRTDTTVLGSGTNIYRLDDTMILTILENNIRQTNFWNFCNIAENAPLY